MALVLQKPYFVPWNTRGVEYKRLMDSSYVFFPLLKVNLPAESVSLFEDDPIGQKVFHTTENTSDCDPIAAPEERHLRVNCIVSAYDLSSSRSDEHWDKQNDNQIVRQHFASHSMAIRFEWLGLQSKSLAFCLNNVLDFEQVNDCS